MIEKQQNASMSKFERFEPLKFGEGNEKSRRFSPACLVNSGLVDKVRTEIRKILQDPQGYPEEMSFFSFLKHLNDNMGSNSLKGGKVVQGNNSCA